MIFHNLSDDDYIASFYITDWEEEERVLNVNHRHKILSMMEIVDLSRLSFIAMKEWNKKLQESLDREIRWRKFQWWSRVDIEDLKASVDILDLVESYVWGVRWKKWGLIKCPLPDHSDGTPSFSLHRDKWYFVCHWCWSRWSVIDFVMKIEWVSLAAAINKLKSFM